MIWAIKFLNVQIQQNIHDYCNSKYIDSSVHINTFFSCCILGNNSSSGADYQPDRPIGYGAFGVVWSVTDPRDGKRVALKKLPNVFQSLVSSKRVFRELKMMIFFKHENVLSCLDILQVI